MIMALTITLLHSAYATDEWQGVIEIRASSSLQALHFAIQHALRFDNDHLYEFFISRTDRSRDRVRFDDENGALYDTSIESLFPLPDRRHLYYYFDYSDSWVFRIARVGKVLQAAKPRVRYPRLATETGVKPEQYPDMSVWD